MSLFQQFLPRSLLWKHSVPSRSCLIVSCLILSVLGCKGTTKENEESKILINVPKTLELTPLHSAARIGDLPAVKTVLQVKDLEIDAGEPQYFATALCVAAEAGHWDVVKELIGAGADIHLVDKLGRTPLMYAVARAEPEIVFFLIGKGANPNVRRVDEKGITPLILAAVRDRPKIIKALVRSGALVDETNFLGRSAMLEAAFYGHEASVRMLVRVGADVNWSDRSGATPLSAAAKMNRMECAKLLVKAKANINSPNHKGRTPLMEAALMGHTEMVEFLLKAGAKKKLRSRSGETALSLAQSAKKEDAVNLLRD